MHEFILFTLVCLAIFILVSAIKKQIMVQPLQPIRIETKEELRKKQLAQKRRQ